MNEEEKTKEEKDKIQYPPYSRWYFIPKTTDFLGLFRSVKEIIAHINPLLRHYLHSQKDVYFSLFRYGQNIELKVFAPKIFLESFQETIKLYETPSIIIKSHGGGDYIGTTSYCINDCLKNQDWDTEMDFRKFLKDSALICCDLYHSNLTKAIDVTIKYEFQNNRPNLTKKIPDELKNLFKENSPHYRSLENDSEDGKFWDGFLYPGGTGGVWNHWYYNMIVGLEYYHSLPPNSCSDYLRLLQSDEQRFGIYITTPPDFSDEESLAFHINKLMGNY